MTLLNIPSLSALLMNMLISIIHGYTYLCFEIKIQLENNSLNTYSIPIIIMKANSLKQELANIKDYANEYNFHTDDEVYKIISEHIQFLEINLDEIINHELFI